MNVQDILAATNTVCISDLVAARNLLWRLQSSYLRAAVRSTKTTPTEGLEIALSLTPLGLGVIGAARFTAYKLDCQGEWKNTGLGHTKVEFLQRNRMG
jgi:hypothetical protein